MSSNKGKIINHKGIQYVREKAENIGSCGECELNTKFNEVCKYSRECELTGTILKLRKKEEENKKVFNPLCPKCHGKVGISLMNGLGIYRVGGIVIV